MITAHNANGQWVAAASAVRGETYYCPVCRDRLVLIFGSQHKVDHFRHYSDNSCSYGADETPEHAEKKLAILSDLQTALGDNNASMEHTLPDGQRPDIYFETRGGQGVAVEVQHSPITDVDLADRTASYSSKKVACLWMPDKIVNAVKAARRTWNGVPLLPGWMTRIGKLTDGVAFDHYAEERVEPGEIISVRLKLAYEEIRTPTGEVATREYWPIMNCILYKGDVRQDRDEHGYDRMLWIPAPVGGPGFVSLQAKRQQRRREVIEKGGAYVDCHRPPVDDVIEKVLESMDRQSGVTSIPGVVIDRLTDAGTEADKILQFWLLHGHEFSDEQKLHAWGYK